ncbi:MAG: lipase secretion chaperone [Pseudomonadota bacterium]
MLAIIWMVGGRSPSAHQAIDAAPAQASTSEGFSASHHRNEEAEHSTLAASSPESAFANEPLPEQAVASWADVAWDGAILFDSNGRLIIDAGLRQRFDFVLTGLGERPLVQLRQLLIDQMRGDFDSAQIQQVLAEFDLYTAFLQAADELMQVTGSDLASRFEAIQALQRDLLGDDRARAWFDDQNIDIARALAIRDGAIEAGNPDSDPMAAELLEATGHRLAVEMNEQYDSLATDPALRFAEREALYGSDAAERLAQLDQERAAWNARLEAYARYRDSLAQQHQMSGAEREQALTDWRLSEFSEAEIRRLLAMEQAGLLPTDP